MAFNFSAMQYERSFRAPNICNWEYPRFTPPRPRILKRQHTTPLADKSGHLLPTAAREGHFLGNYRGTYNLPRRITRSFATENNNCLSGRHKYAKYPRDLCHCHRQTQKQQSDYCPTLGKSDDPNWQRTKCPSPCELLQPLFDIDRQSRLCSLKGKSKCQAVTKFVPRPSLATKLVRKHIKRPVTAFDFNRSPAPAKRKGNANVTNLSMGGRNDINDADSQDTVPGKKRLTATKSSENCKSNFNGDIELLGKSGRGNMSNGGPTA